MTRRAAAWRALRTAAALTVLAGVVGCTDPGTHEPTTPEGWQRVESGVLSFAVPGDWVEVRESNDPWTLAFGTDAELGADSVVLTTAPEISEDGARNAVHLFVAGAQVAGWGYRSTSVSTPVDTDGLTVERNDFTYEDVQGVFWAASRTEAGPASALKLTGRDLPEDLVTGIEESIVVRDG